MESSFPRIVFWNFLMLLSYYPWLAVDPSTTALPHFRIGIIRLEKHNLHLQGCAKRSWSFLPSTIFQLVMGLIFPTKSGSFCLVKFVRYRPWSDISEPAPYCLTTISCCCPPFAGSEVAGACSWALKASWRAFRGVCVTSSMSCCKSIPCWACTLGDGGLLALKMTKFPRFHFNIFFDH